MFKTIKTPEQIAAEQAEQQREQRITELKRLLAESDFRVLPDYDKDSEAIKAQRQAWREEIRQLEAQQ
jgi:hypothetical protein